MAAVTATARRSMCIVAARKAASTARFVDTSLSWDDASARWGVREREICSAYTVSARDLTVYLLDPNLPPVGSSPCTPLHRYIVFQMAEEAVPRLLFRAILERIRRLRLPETVPG